MWSDSTFWSIAGNIATVAVGVATVIGWAKRWANRYLANLVQQTLHAQAELMGATGDIAKGITGLTTDVRVLSETVGRLGTRLDRSDQRLDDHLREADRLRQLVESHMSDHAIHSPFRP